MTDMATEGRALRTIEAAILAGVLSANDGRAVLDTVARKIELDIEAREHDRRATELLTANNLLLERARAADRKNKELLTALAAATLLVGKVTPYVNAAAGIIDP